MIKELVLTIAGEKIRIEGERDELVAIALNLEEQARKRPDRGYWGERYDGTPLYMRYQPWVRAAELCGGLRPCRTCRTLKPTAAGGELRRWHGRQCPDCRNAYKAARKGKAVGNGN